MNRTYQNSGDYMGGIALGVVLSGASFLGLPTAGSIMIAGGLCSPRAQEDYRISTGLIVTGALTFFAALPATALALEYTAGQIQGLRRSRNQRKSRLEE